MHLCTVTRRQQIPTKAIKALRKYISPLAQPPLGNTREEIKRSACLPRCTTSSAGGTPGVEASQDLSAAFSQPNPS